ncbi:MAG: hypothetical protein GEU90_18925 [Gemmatimonas sp.]|nr:hypothetical protein [Gemmatimonas sp.]
MQSTDLFRPDSRLIPQLVSIPLVVWASSVITLKPADAQLSRPVATADEEPNPLNRKARLSVHEAELSAALTALQIHSGATLVYSPTQLPQRQVSCQCYDMTVGEALDRLLAASRLRYSLLRGRILIEPQGSSDYRYLDIPTEVVGSGFLLAAGASGRSFAPVSVDRRTAPHRTEGTITGRVVDAQTQRPLASAQVFVLETSIGALTRADGSYQLTNVPDGTHTIRVQLIGYTGQDQTATVAPGSSSVVDFEMAGEALALDEIVVTGTAGAHSAAPSGT